MSKFLKNISTYPLLLACLVIIAHMAIPHDHHTDISISDGKCQTTSHSGESSSKSGFPAHCHAFNDLINEKHSPILTTSQNLPSLEFPQLGLPSSDTYDSSAAELIINNNRYRDFQKPSLNSEILKYSPLRAPPSLV